MKFETFLKKNKLLIFILVTIFIVASYFLFFKKENFQQGEYFNQEQCHESRAECNNPDYPDGDVHNISSNTDIQDLKRVCFKKCSLVPDQNGRYVFSDSDKEGNMCIIRDENAPRNTDGTYVFPLGIRPFVPATCNQRPQCLRVSCPVNTSLFKYGGMNFLGSSNETTLEGDIIFNNSCVRRCEERSGLELSENDTNCFYYDRRTGDVDSLSKDFVKPTCEDSRSVSLRGVRFSTATCTYGTQQRSLASFRSNMRCPAGHTLETHTKNGVVLPRCIRLVNKVNNRCPNGTFETTPSSNRCRQFRNPICRDSRETFDKKNGLCLKGSCSRGKLFDKRCYKCNDGFVLNETNLRCEKRGSRNQAPQVTTPLCYSI
jgi:hypothetical protein